MIFPIYTHKELIDCIKKFDAHTYCKTRNYITGTVSKLSPYITHGIITIQDIITVSLDYFSLEKNEQWFKELVRREYFVHTHRHRGNDIFGYMEGPKVLSGWKSLLPVSLEQGTTGTQRVDACIRQLQSSGYLHNHQRMWLASWCTHRQRLDPLICADWTYYYFLDGELGSNHLSRQRVASTFSHKPYYMNEENIQRYRPGYGDKDLRGTYEEVEKRIRDNNRHPSLHNDNDCYSQLITDTSMIQKAHDRLPGYKAKKITILTPWDFHPSKIINTDQCVCFLDINFLTRHPRSPQRIQWIQAYANLYTIPLIVGDLGGFVERLVPSIQITMYQTRNPLYRDIQEKYKKKITYIPHQRVYPHANNTWTPKFFTYRNKVKKYINK